jgi:hypothetical protein
LFELSEIESQQVMELISFDDAVRGWLDAVENSHPRVESNKIHRR